MIQIDDEYLVPALRQEINFKISEENEEKFIVLTDPLGFASQSIALPINIAPLFQLINGEFNFGDIKKIISDEIQNDSSYVLDVFRNLIINLDYLGYLDSPMFQFIKNDLESYLNSEIREPVCAGSSYPSNPSELMDFCKEIIELQSVNVKEKKSRAVIVPHLDLRTGEETLKAYSSAYKAISESKADLFIVLGTSHYGYSDHFMLTLKDYNTPLGIVNTDKDLINKLRNRLSYNIKFDDIAHRHEHSIELQTIFLKTLFNDRDFSVLPILVGSFHSHVLKKSKPIEESKIYEFLTVLRNIISESGREAVIIASVDFSHIGKKFGDDFAAVTKLEEIRNSDSELLESILGLSGEDFFRKVSECSDKNRICGLSPIYSLLKLFSYSSSDFLHYGQWIEEETESAVTFSSISFK